MDAPSHFLAGKLYNLYLQYSKGFVLVQIFWIFWSKCTYLHLNTYSLYNGDSHIPLPQKYPQTKRWPRQQFFAVWWYWLLRYRRKPAKCRLGTYRTSYCPHYNHRIWTPFIGRLTLSHSFSLLAVDSTCRDFMTLSSFL